MKRVLAVVDTTRFWVAVFLLALGFVFVYAYSANRADVARNTILLVEQRRALSYLCETVRVIDAIYVQTAALDTIALRDPNIPASVRALIADRRRVLRTAHQELSNTRACRRIE